jgi:hypothetical protein
VAGILGESTFCMAMYLFILVFFWENLIVYFVQELYRLPEDVSEDDALLVFNNSV